MGLKSTHFLFTLKSRGNFHVSQVRFLKKSVNSLETFSVSTAGKTAQVCTFFFKRALELSYRPLGLTA